MTTILLIIGFAIIMGCMIMALRINNSFATSAILWGLFIVIVTIGLLIG